MPAAHREEQTNIYEALGSLNAAADELSQAVYRAEKASRAVQETLTDQPETRTAAEPLHALSDADALLRHTEAAVYALVDDARARGASWGEVATRLGISRQGAQQRYGARF